MSSTELRESPIVLFDGDCRLCNASVRWIIERDPHGVFRFASLQSQAARAAIAEVSPAGCEPSLTSTTPPDSVVLIDAARIFTRSNAALRIAKRLGFPWSMAAAARILPRGARDLLYDLVARNRYRWFGKQASCSVLTPSLRARFLDAEEDAELEENRKRFRPGVGAGPEPG
ncbi:MAG: thiol-disulfide oxidoreductase DCC family protein [Planctomycetota bacterium]